MQAYHGFLADSNIQKNPRAGQTPTQAVVSPDYNMAGGRVSGQSISVSELQSSRKGWDVGRNKEFILWLKFSTLSPCPAYSRLVWLFLFPSPLTSPSLQDGLKFFECSLTFDYIPGQGRLWILLLKTLELSQLPVCQLIFTCWWEEPHSKANNMIDAWTGVNGENIDREGALAWSIRGCLPKRICH